MRRVHLPDEGEHGWSYDPSSIEHVIEAHLRHGEIATRRLNERLLTSESRLPLKTVAVGLSEAELDAIWQEGRRLFWESASLSHELRDERERFRTSFSERVERFLKNPDREINELAERHAVLFAQTCDGAVKRASGEFADLLTQAVIARRGRKDFPLGLRADMWAECLRFSMKMARFDAAGEWVDRAWGHAPKESPLPHIHTLDTMALQRADVAKFSAKFRAKFEERLRHGSPRWLDEADRRIELRRLLSSAPQRLSSLDDPSKRAVANLLFINPKLQARELCAKLDSGNERNPIHPAAPLPKKWIKKGVRLWMEAYERFRGNVKSYFSKVRSENGIAAHRHS
jgi:hypothetical protein